MSSNPTSSQNEFLASLGKIEKQLLLGLILHPGWMSLPFLKSASEGSEAQLQQVLKKFESFQYIQKSEEEPYYWTWKAAEVSESFLQFFSEQDVISAHQRLFHYIASLENSSAYVDMLLFHAARGGLKAWAYGYSLLLAEACSEENKLEEAIQIYEQAMPFAETDFKQAYLSHELAALQFGLGRYEQAAELWQQALDKAETIPWPPLMSTCSLSLANLYSHQGLFSKAEVFYRRCLDIVYEGRDVHAKRQILQNLASSLIEQGRYNEALQILNTLSQTQDTSNFEKISIAMHQARVYTALGNFSEVRNQFENIEKRIEAGELNALKPYLDFLRGRFELAQGRFVEAFRCFEEAAHGFELAEDLAGKIDVLLSLSSVLLENLLLREANQLVAQISEWKDLERYPALEQAIRLRRLTLSAFSGQWVQKDISLLNPQAEKAGRQEDWLEFWFHLGLAALRIDNSKLADSFFSRAKNILDRITEPLSTEQVQGFRQRPIIARLFRLLEKDNRPLSETQAVRADQAALDFLEAPEASLAPPISNRPTK